MNPPRASDHDDLQPPASPGVPYPSKIIADGPVHVENKTSHVRQETHHHHYAAPPVVAGAASGGVGPGGRTVQVTVVLCLGGVLGALGLWWKFFQNEGGPEKSTGGTAATSTLSTAPIIIQNTPVQTVIVMDPTTRAQLTAPTVAPVPPLAQVPDGLLIRFDRPDRLYYHGDQQALSITVPQDGYLYVASIWADGQARLLCHPDWLQPVPGPVKRGQTVDIPVVRMTFTPAHADDPASAEEVRAILSTGPLPTLPADRKADVSAAWSALGFTVGIPGLRQRGGELPDPEHTRSESGALHVTAPYRMERGARPAP